MAETLASLRAEFQSRGFSDLTTARANRIINDAYSSLVRLHLWPFREATATGPAPLTVADLGVIASVVNTAAGFTSLDHMDLRTLVDRFGDITAAGTPEWFYIENGTTVKTYPAGGTLQVRYWKAALPLVADSDTVIVPDEYAEIIVDRAVRRGYLDADNFEAANALRAEYQEKEFQMVVELLGQQAHNSPVIVVDGNENA